MIWHDPALSETLLAAGAIAPHRLVAFAPATQLASQADGTAPPLGVAGPLGAAGGAVAQVTVAGVARVELGATVAAGAALKADADGRAVTATVGEFSCGAALGAGDAGDLIPLLLHAQGQPAPAWDDLDFAMTVRSTGPNTPSLAQIGTTGIYAYTYANGKEAFFQRQIAHAYQVGTVWRPHVHWLPTTSDRYTGSFALTYLWHPAASGALSPLRTVTGGTFDINPATALATQLTNLDPITESFGISGIVFARLAVTLTAGTSLILSGMDWHGQVDGLGSQEEFIKHG
jgi:hypothetical protein